MLPPKVSVILPVYNQEKYIAQTIDSVLAQTFQDFEIVILDDGSTDNTAQVIKEYLKKDGRIRAYFHDNAGRSEAANKIVSMARGELCAFLDADDIMLPQRLEKQVAYHLAHPNVSATSCNCRYIDSDGNDRGVAVYPGLRSEAECRAAISENKIVMIAITGLMIYREAYVKIGGMKKNFWPCDDLEISNNIIEQGYILVIIQEILMKYRVHPNSDSVKNRWYVLNYTAYARYAIKQRRANLPVESYKEYEQRKNKDPWLERLNRKKHNYAIIYQKKAGFSLHGKDYVRFLYQMAIVVLCDFSYAKAALANRRKR
ncbi:glycosyltransferase [Mucilaginibacter sp. PAMB04274]|uniref:glycosyltransferase family 2 protein n=1 Tax=Mucilaginibacter sp. PAMB04274 TaxID=3138568 RepID=UPI0031F705C1